MAARRALRRREENFLAVKLDGLYFFSFSLSSNDIIYPMSRPEKLC